METVAGDAERQEMRRRIERGLDAGALAVGMGLAYTPGATRSEVIEVFRVAAEHRVPVFVHVRSSGRVEPGSSVESVAEVIAAAAITGAALHIVHINSSCMADAPECLQMIDGAAPARSRRHRRGLSLRRGHDRSEVRGLQSGWQQRIGITEHEIAIPETGERLTPETFARYRAQAQPRLVLIYTNPDPVVERS